MRKPFPLFLFHKAAQMPQGFEDKTKKERQVKCMNAKNRKGSRGCRIRGKTPHRNYAVETGAEYRKNFSRGTVVRPVFNYQRVRKGA